MMLFNEELELNEVKDIDRENNENEYIDELTILTRGVDFSVRELKIMVEENELIVPEFQRELVWDNKRKSRFIESILLGYPIPGMFFTDIENGQMMIIDGQQRINTLVEFINNEHKISNIKEINPKWRNKFYRDFDLEDKSKLRSSNIRASVFKMLSNNIEEKNIALYSLFERINTGSIQLNSQEIRRSIYFGELVKSINNYVEEVTWKKAYRLIDGEKALSVSKDKRLHDQEIIARTLTMMDLLEKDIDKDISYKQEINRYMSQKKDITKSEAQMLINKIEMVIDWLEKNTNIEVGYFFRKPLDKIDYEIDINGLKTILKNKRFNIPLFETIMYVIYKNINKVKFNETKYISLFQDEQFLTSISSQTNKKVNIEYRLKKINEVFSCE